MLLPWTVSNEGQRKEHRPDRVPWTGAETMAKILQCFLCLAHHSYKNDEEKKKREKKNKMRNPEKGDNSEH